MPPPPGPPGWYDWNRPPHENPYARPPGPPGWYGAGGFGGPPAWPQPPMPPVYPVPPPTAPAPGRASPERKRRRDGEHRSRRERDGARPAEAAAAEAAGDGHSTGDAALDERVADGEALIAGGKALKQRGSCSKAYEKYCKGPRCATPLGS